ncbi:hypothetical protein [Halopseudomonas sp.]|uniref:hypothetical protein n=1 Tax=Halopseudomonas sp. TaxID=2901191 RepID=UPI0030026771
MFRHAAYPALLLSAALLAGTAVAQETPATAQPAADPATATQQHDLGTLQAELAKVEAERQRLADQLAGSGQSEELQALQDENQQLRNANQAERLSAQSKLVQQRQQWFLIGGLTVAVSLLLGFMLAKGGRRKRNEWLN